MNLDTLANDRDNLFGAPRRHYGTTHKKAKYFSAEPIQRNKRNQSPVNDPFLQTAFLRQNQPGHHHQSTAHINTLNK
jgi:hypothetical protein